MGSSKLRRQIAWQAARLIHEQQESEYYRAKLVAARKICRGRIKPADFPSNAEIREEIQRLTRQHPDVGNGGLLNEPELDAFVDRFEVFRALLVPLESVHQNPAYHPEGDALYHSLQVFDQALEYRPYDEEFLLAALLHDVGKGLDPRDHVHSALNALGATISPRTAWLIEHHMLAHQIHDHSIGARRHRRLRENENYSDLLLLGECDRAGRQVGVMTTSLDDALDYLREIGQAYE